MTDGPLAPFLDLDRGRARFATHRRRTVELEDEPLLLAGAAEVDITPPPGLPKAGYSANANDGTGFRTRLRARVTHLRSGRASIAIVACDLLGGSSVIQHLVADAIAERTDIGLAGVWIGATHTHAGPGQFLGTDFYNRFASNRRGFDPAWAAFLVERIAGAVIEAHDTRRPARLALGSTEVWGLTRNRSLPPHVRNETVDDKRTEPQRKYVSTNPELQLLRVDAERADGGTEPLSAAVVFSVHGTGISMRSTEYNADLWAYLVGELAYRIGEAGGGQPVVGAMEGTHADVAPALRPGMAGHVEAQRVGRAIGAEAAALWERLEGALRAEVELGAALREIDLAASPTIGDVRLPDRPAVGASLVAGAHENVTPVVHRIPPFKAGSPKRWGIDNPHGHKWVLGSRWLQPLVIPLRTFPRVLPVHVLRIGDAALVGLPFEVTVESGRRVAAEVVASTGLEHAVVSSVVNEYSGYVATAEEYELQHYEGGHTLYGPRTQAFVGAHAAELASRLTAAGGVVDETLADRRWDLQVRRYLPRPTGSAPRRLSLGTPTFSDPTSRHDAQWEWRWRDAPPGDLRWHDPMVRVEQCDPDGDWEPATHRGRPIDDQGWYLEVEHVGSDDVGHTYAVRWHDPRFRAGRRHRFVLSASGSRPELASEPFD